MTRTARLRARLAAVLALPLLVPVLVTGSPAAAAPAAPAVAASPAAASAPAPGGETPELVVVLDSSGSMAEADAGGGRTRMDAAKQAVTTMAASAPASARIGLRTYGDGVDSEAPGSCEDTTLRVPVGPVDRAAITAQVQGLAPRGDTPIGVALRAAGGDLTTSGPRTVVLVSDGEPTCDPDPCVVAGELAAQGVDLRIDVVGLRVDQAARDILSCVAEAGGGTYVDADDAEDLVAALGTSATRSFRDYQALGTPVTGTPSPAGAPELVDGRWLDELAVDATRHYVVPRRTGETVHVGAVLSPPQGSRDGVEGIVTVDLVSVGGQTCSRGVELYDPQGGNDVIAVSTSFGPESEYADTDGCLEGPVGIEVGWTRGRTDAAQPLELLVQVEPAVDARPSGAPVDPDVAYPVPAPLAPAAPVEGGSGVGSATLLGPGGWGDALRPGEVSYYRVPLAWGQQLAFRADVPEPPEDGPDLGLAPSDVVRVSVLNRFGGDITPEGDGSQTIAFSPTSGASVWLTTHPVRWTNRLQHDDPAVEASALDGEVVVRVSLSAGTDVDAAEGATLPVILTAAVLGEPEAGPAYVEPEAEPSAEPSAPASEPATTTPSPDASVAAPAADDVELAAADDGRPPVGLLVGLGLVAVLLLAALVALVVWGVRSSRTGPAAPSGPT